jgi:endoglucanase
LIKSVATIFYYIIEMKLFVLPILCFLLFSCIGQSNDSKPVEQFDFVNLNQVFWDGKNELIRGIAIGNNVWSANEANLQINDIADYARLRASGFNSVRFYLSYKFFENDVAPYSYKQRGWDFLNQNLEWARENGIKLILNMHVPQGGFQSNGEGAALWNVEENQNRLIALWKEIASRYANDAAIAAYDILNEPVVSKNKAQWQKLAQEIVNAIREVDSNHFILVERINGIIPDNYSNDSEMNYVFIDDPVNKWGLTFHFYSPIEYTHQYATWVDAFKDTDGGRYPDQNLLQFSGEQWVGTTSNNPAIQSGDSDWIFYEGEWKTIADTSIANIGRPSLQCQNVQRGTVWFDNLVFEKRTSEGVVSTIATYKLPFGMEGWYFWKEKEGGTVIKSEIVAGVGVTGTISDANYATSKMFVALEQGYSYRVSGKMKGEDVPQGAACRIRFDWNYAKSLSRRNKAFLENEVDLYLKIAQEKNLPVYLGEFGVIKFAANDEKGGYIWISDMLDILKSHDVSYNYHAWVDDFFGVKDDANLENLFKNKFLGRR